MGKIACHNPWCMLYVLAKSTHCLSLSLCWLNGFLIRIFLLVWFFWILVHFPCIPFPWMILFRKLLEPNSSPAPLTSENLIKSFIINDPSISSTLYSSCFTWQLRSLIRSPCFSSFPWIKQICGYLLAWILMSTAGLAKVPTRVLGYWLPKGNIHPPLNIPHIYSALEFLISCLACVWSRVPGIKHSLDPSMLNPRRSALISPLSFWSCFLFIALSPGIFHNETTLVDPQHVLLNSHLSLQSILII